MKKFLCITLISVLMLSLCSCQNSTSKNENNESQEVSIKQLEDEQIIVFFENSDITLDFNQVSTNSINFRIISDKDLSSSKISAEIDIPCETNINIVDVTSNYKTENYMYPGYIIFEQMDIDWMKYYDLFEKNSDLLTSEGKELEEYTEFIKPYSQKHEEICKNYSIDYFVYDATLNFIDVSKCEDFTFDNIKFTIDETVIDKEIGTIKIVGAKDDNINNKGILSSFGKFDMALDINTENKVLQLNEMFSTNENEITITNICALNDEFVNVSDVTLSFTDNGVPVNHVYENGDKIEIPKQSTGTINCNIIDNLIDENLYINRSYYLNIEYLCDGKTYNETVQLVARTRPSPEEIIAYVNADMDFRMCYESNSL